MAGVGDGIDDGKGWGMRICGREIAWERGWKALVGRKVLVGREGPECWEGLRWDEGEDEDLRLWGIFGGADMASWEGERQADGTGCDGERKMESLEKQNY